MARIAGTNDNDKLTGDGDGTGDEISGLDGQDTIAGDNTDDTISGGDGEDYLRGTGGDDSLSGGAGRDDIYGGAGADTIDGGKDQDRARGGTGDDVFDGFTSGDDFKGDADRDAFILDRYASGGWIDGGMGGDDVDTLDLTGLDGNDYLLDYAPATEDGTIRIRDSSGNLGQEIAFQEIERVAVCFTPGARIATPEGPRAVETLREGDRVLTRDNGVRAIRWAAFNGLSAADLARDPALAPILIREGALGGGLPERDMMVSPNHRMLVCEPRVQLYLAENEVLVAAKHLTRLPGVERIAVSGVNYHHLLFDIHEIIRADGTWTESFCPGDYSLNGIGAAQRAEVLTLFPELASQRLNTARRVAKKHEASLILS